MQSGALLNLEQQQCEADLDEADIIHNDTLKEIKKNGRQISSHGN